MRRFQNKFLSIRTNHPAKHHRINTQLLDLDTIVASVRKTSRAIVIDGGYLQYGVTGEIAAAIAEHAFDWLDCPVLRLGAENVPVPFSKTLEPLFLPDGARIAAAARALVRGDAIPERKL